MTFETLDKACELARRISGYENGRMSLSYLQQLYDRLDGITTETTDITIEAIGYPVFVPTLLAKKLMKREIERAKQDYERCKKELEEL